jgi:hypothetical protein
MNDFVNIGILIFAIVCLIAVFIALRHFVLWYFRINEHIEVMKNQNILLAEMRDHLFNQSERMIKLMKHMAA